jgi:hypothetical protein
MAKLRAPFPYYGSKIGASKLIERLMGPINNLVVPFAGSLGEILGRSAPAKVETVNDADGLVVNAWRGLVYSPEAMAELCDHPVHETTMHAAHDLLLARAPELPELLRSDPKGHDVELAAWWVWGRSCWLGGGWCQDAEAASAGENGGMRVRVLGRGGTPYYGQGVAKPQRGHSKRQIPRLRGSDGTGVGYGVGVNAGRNRGELLDYFAALADRLRWVRITCGDWTRVVTPAVTTSHGLTGVSLDPPYCHTLRSTRLYREDSPTLSADVRGWAVERGDDPLLRITLAGKDDEHDVLLEHGGRSTRGVRMAR